MANDKQLDRAISGWLEAEAPPQLPDRVLVATFERTRGSKQQGGWRAVPGRLHMNGSNKFVPIGLGVAAVAVVLVVGAQLFGPAAPSGVGAAPSAAPSATPPASATPSPTTAPSTPPTPAGLLEPGPFRVSSPETTPVAATISVPAGWTEQYPGQLVKNADGPAEIGMGFDAVTKVYADACQSEGTLTDIGPSADDLVTALLAQKHIAADGPTDLTIGGYPAQRIDLAFPPDLDTSTCRVPGLLIQVWADAAEEHFFVLATGNRGSVYVVNVDGKRVVITTFHGPDATEADIAEVEAMIASTTFGA